VPPIPIRQTLDATDLSGRIPYSTAVAASPAAAAETIICQINTRAQTNDLAVVSGVILNGWAAYTVGTNGTAVQFRIRQTGLAGTVVGNTGALSGSQHGAGILSADDVSGVDTAPPAGGIYVLTMQVTAGSAASTVSAVLLYAIII
jgi:hypothetical protein